MRIISRHRRHVTQYIWRFRDESQDKTGNRAREYDDGDYEQDDSMAFIDGILYFILDLA